MKIKIDTSTKIIQLEQSAKLTELFSLVKKLFPNDEWKQYSLEAVTIINNWNTPIYIPSVWRTDIPFNDGWEITCSGNAETYCIEAN